MQIVTVKYHLFREWLHGLKSIETRNMVERRIFQIYQGNFGKYKPVGGGVYELIFKDRPGTRVYFVKLTLTAVMLLYGGNKHGQQVDIDKSIEIWRCFNGISI